MIYAYFFTFVFGLFSISSFADDISYQIVDALHIAKINQQQSISALLDLLETTDNQETKSFIQYNLGTLYLLQGNNEKAHFFLIQTLNSKLHEKSIINFTICLMNRLEAENDPKKLDELIKNAYAISKKYNLSNIAKILPIFTTRLRVLEKKQLSTLPPIIFFEKFSKICHDLSYFIDELSSQDTSAAYTPFLQDKLITIENLFSVNDEDKRIFHTKGSTVLERIYELFIESSIRSLKLRLTYPQSLFYLRKLVSEDIKRIRDKQQLYNTSQMVDSYIQKILQEFSASTSNKEVQSQYIISNSLINPTISVETALEKSVFVFTPLSTLFYEYLVQENNNSNLIEILIQRIGEQDTYNPNNEHNPLWVKWYTYDPLQAMNGYSILLFRQIIEKNCSTSQAIQLINMFTNFTQNASTASTFHTSLARMQNILLSYLQENKRKYTILFAKSLLLISLYKNTQFSPDILQKIEQVVDELHEIFEKEHRSEMLLEGLNFIYDVLLIVSKKEIPLSTENQQTFRTYIMHAYDALRHTEQKKNFDFGSAKKWIRAAENLFLSVNSSRTLENKTIERENKTFILPKQPSVLFKRLELEDRKQYYTSEEKP